MIFGGLRTKGITKQSHENQPLITVVTVVRNGEKTLEETILSVINQTYTNIEYIIIDGASNDGTLEIVRKYEDRIDYWISEPDKGIYDAMNKGIDLATGEYISLINSDDYYEKDACEIIVNKINEVNADIYYGMMRVIDKNNNMTMYIYGYTINVINLYMIAHPTCFIKNDIYKLHKYDIKYKSSADYDFIIYLKKRNYYFQFIERIILNFRSGGMSDSLLALTETNNILRKHKIINPIIYLLKIFYINIKRILDI